MPLRAGRLREIAVVGAHCDDIAIGMGATLLTLTTAEPGLRVRALVLCGAGSEREAEELDALEAFCPGADVELEVGDIPDGHAPAHWGQVKSMLRALRDRCDPSIVFGPHRADAHQDHRLLAELLPTEFRDHLVMGYEILKWETDAPMPNVFVPVTAEMASSKARLLHKCYPSQAMHDWFDEEAFLGLARLRGVQCRHRHAEAFVLEKTALVMGGASCGCS
ncbi:PIG-L family deacetylase [Mycolicibacterium rufum]|uniref:PIG-L family deacetylase n=2 Tax=Mycolicibacterium rufum TaxID=318424 RepID=A0A9X3BPY4_9MYCO|nr:PIG-L family deacetylase [Mycolicibacterium rufum]MCV7071967.1 PIG-L family deacetylase [Mycolicibacterium rufum]ULP36305.1 PIG-L family deacetylase [Mycolicibacterium rufum]